MANLHNKANSNRAGVVFWRSLKVIQTWMDRLEAFVQIKENCLQGFYTDDSNNVFSETVCPSKVGRFVSVQLYKSFMCL